MKFAYARPDGGVNIVSAACKEALAPLLRKHDADGFPLPFTDADYRAHVLERNGVTEAEIINLPDSWTGPDGPRASWIIENGQIVSDPIKAQAARIPWIKAEAQRRIIAVVGAKDLTSCLVKQLNANMRANELNDIQASRAFTPEEEAEASALRALAAQIKAIRAASDALELTAPADYTNNTYWPD